MTENNYPYGTPGVPPPQAGSPQPEASPAPPLAAQYPEPAGYAGYDGFAPPQPAAYPEYPVPDAAAYLESDGAPVSTAMGEDPFASGVSEGQGPVENGPTIIQTDADASDGLAKCPRCGATEIALNSASGMLQCSFCRFEWIGASAFTHGLNGPISELVGVVMGSGAGDIIPSTETVLTFKCSACGAEVVIDTNNASQARCHWCRNKLSMNQQIPNGAIPDMILPFSLPKEEAVRKIGEFVRKRKFFANKKFTAEFDPENVMGVYLPYMVVDVNAKASLAGYGEHLTRRYTVGTGDSKKTRYDADLYEVQRGFDIHIDDLTVESSSTRRDQNALVNSNNIINSIMPFDVENSVKYDANYLAGFSSERRDTNVDELMELVHTQSKDIGRHAALETLQFYDRGVNWTHEELSVVGQRWISAYLPVWLYSYQEVKRNGKSLVHYVAVNARTGETMGSVPTNQVRLLTMSALVEVVGIVAFVLFMLLGS